MKEANISMKLVMTKENRATPKRRIMDQTTLSALEIGEKSPKPIVERVVIAKYTHLIKLQT